MPRIVERMLKCAAVGLLFAAWSISAQAAAPSETLLPGSTVGWVSVPDVPKLIDQWNKTQLGQLLKDPVMEPFVKDVERQFDQRSTGLQERLGLTVDDVRGLARGELALAVIQPDRQKDQVATALLVDVTGNLEQAKAVVAKASENLVRRGAKKSQTRLAGVEVTVFDLPEQEQGRQVNNACYFLTEEWLGAADDQATIDGILQRLGGQKGNALADAAAFQQVMKRVRQDAGDAVPHFRWFIEPFGYTEALRAAAPEQKPRKGKSTLQVLQEQGFTAHQGLGGYVDLAVDDYQILHRTAIYAPPPYEKSMQMMQFPNQSEFTPQPWVPRELASYTSFYLDILNAFDNFGPLVDAQFGEEGVWQDVLDGLKDPADPHGPHVDLRNELVAKLGQRVSILTAYELPITITSERILLAVEAKDSKAVAAAIEKIFKSDKAYQRRQYGQSVLWESIPPKKAEAAKIDFELPGSTSASPKAPARAKRKERDHVFPNLTITVAHGHLLFASHADFLRQILEQADGRGSAARSAEYQQVAETLKRMGAAADAMWSFTQTDEQIRPTYELIRQGKMFQSQTLLGRALRMALGTGEKDGEDRQVIDPSTMPDYEVVRRYLGPSGSFLTTEPDGWFLKGVLLTK